MKSHSNHNSKFVANYNIRSSKISVIYFLAYIGFSLSLYVGSQGLKDLYRENICIYNSYQPSWMRQEPRAEGMNEKIPNCSSLRSYVIWDSHQSCKKHKHGSNFYENQDTISHDDIVVHQYSSLPYPPVNEHQLEVEKSHYMSNHSEKYPFSMYHSITLENINHFLFNGNNNFR